MKEFESLEVSHEGAVRSAFQTLLEDCGKRFGWKLIPEWIRRDKTRSIRIDGALVDEYRLPHGFWEAKDTHDDLPKEVKKKIKAGYPQNNIIFQAPERAILWQDGRAVLDLDITEPTALIEILKQFFEYLPPEYEDWQEAVAHFQDQVPELGQTLKEIIEREQDSHTPFRAAFDDFFALCRQSINPNISKEAVEEMLIQHLLTERIFRTVFNNPDFTRRNAIAAEIEKVIDALTSQAFSRDAFLQRLDRFYGAIEKAARTIEDFSQKQEFLNTVYEKFFQGFSVKVADTHGIVYTPVSIVNFMVRSVEDILQKEFGKSLSSSDVHILDPFVGTGNFIVHIMQAIKKTALAQKYSHELHCNEVMLLPYYIASMNIEHEFYELTGGYESFEGICLVDTFELAEDKQIAFFTTENTARVEKQKQTPLFVIIGNPPYNANQQNENDNNKNRKYKLMDRRVAETYAKDSIATNKNALSDPYVKAVRWASDKINETGEGIVALVTNNGFIEDSPFDGMRRNLAHDFDAVYVLDLGGNVRRNNKLSGTTHNVFGIQVGVSVEFLVRRRKRSSVAAIYYSRVDEYWRREEKYLYLDQSKHTGNISWTAIEPDEKNTWLTEGLHDEFDVFIPVGSKETKASSELGSGAIFKSYSNGVKTNRDAWAYNFNPQALSANIKRTIEAYNEHAFKLSRSPTKYKKLDDFVTRDETRISWSEGLKSSLLRGSKMEFEMGNVRRSLYRPFTRQFLYFDADLNERRYQIQFLFPGELSELENKALAVTGHSQLPFSSQVLSCIPCLDVGGRPTQCFPFYTYEEDGTNRRENITDWSLEQFRSHYKTKSITKWDIFHYIYAVFHHPLYRQRYAANLKRELPRIPFAPDFKEFTRTGKRLAEIHVNYEQQPEHPLEKVETPGVVLDWRVEKMKLSKDKRSLIYNDFLTLSGIPPEVFEYRLGNRSALDWIIDQYQVSTDKRSGIPNDPNRSDDPEYIVRLIGQVTAVSLETVQLVRRLNKFSIAEPPIA
ncbi:MAG TPA: type ISP restriction/modification enzyme [Pyrinomonadaceae bacterium]|nr:type ISP restriction/modification enzyme [Pyrinomonadaceae bacterium]